MVKGFSSVTLINSLLSLAINGPIIDTQNKMYNPSSKMLTIITIAVPYMQCYFSMHMLTYCTASATYNIALRNATFAQNKETIETMSVRLIYKII